MTTISSNSKVSKRVYYLSTLALCGGYYLGQLVLWVMGLKGIPKMNFPQLMNATLIYVLGFALVKMFDQMSQPLKTSLFIAGAVTLVRYLVVCLTDLEGHSLAFVFQRNLMEIVTFGVMSAIAVVCGYYTYKRMT
jgi:hypothetical protein